MKRSGRPAATVLFALVGVLVFSSAAAAGDRPQKGKCTIPPIHIVNPPVYPPVHPPVNPPVHPPVTVHPPTPCPVPIPHPIPGPSPTIRWRFGFHVSLTSTAYGTGILVQSVDPFGAAARSGMQVGDIILTANGRGFGHAVSNHHCVHLLQQAADLTPGGPVPTTTVANWQPAPAPGVHLVVLRHGQTYAIHVLPTPVGVGSGGSPTRPVPTF